MLRQQQSLLLPSAQTIRVAEKQSLHGAKENTQGQMVMETAFLVKTSAKAEIKSRRSKRKSTATVE